MCCAHRGICPILVGAHILEVIAQVAHACSRSSSKQGVSQGACARRMSGRGNNHSTMTMAGATRQRWVQDMDMRGVVDSDTMVCTRCTKDLQQGGCVRLLCERLSWRLC